MRVKVILQMRIKLQDAKTAVILEVLVRVQMRNICILNRLEQILTGELEL